MYSDSTLQQLIGLSYMVDSTYIVLFSLCLFTTSSKCTMFTGVVLICGFSLSLSVSLSPSFSIYDSIRIDVYSKDLPGGWTPFASSQAVFREHFSLHQTLNCCIMHW